MKNTYTYVDRVSSHYVGNDCVQLMIGYKKYMTMFNKYGVQYYHVPNSIGYINSYLEDKRKNLFPYNDIPIHCGRIGLSKYTYTNQLLNFEEPYIAVSENGIIERIAILDKDEAFVVSNVLSIRKKIVRMTREQLEELFRTKNEKGEMSFVIQPGGCLWQRDYFENLITEDEIVDWTKKELKKVLSDDVLAEYDFAYEWLSKNISRLGIESIPKVALDLDGFVLVKITNGNISVQLINGVNFLGPNQYEVIIADLPLMEQVPNKENLRMLDINDLKEPRILKRLNPSIDSKLIKDNKRLVRRLK